MTVQLDFTSAHATAGWSKAHSVRLERNVFRAIDVTRARGGRRQILMRLPSSTTRLAGRPKKSPALEATRASTRNSFSCQRGSNGRSASTRAVAADEEGRAHRIEREPLRARQLAHHVGLVHEAEAQRRREQAVAERSTSTRSSARPTGTSRNSTVRSTTRSCSTLLCLRLCSSAVRRAVGVGGEEDRGARHAVRRLGLEAARAAARAAARRSFSAGQHGARPRRQVGHDDEDAAPIGEREPAAVADLEQLATKKREVDRPGRSRAAASASPSGQSSAQRETKKAGWW